MQQSLYSRFRGNIIILNCASVALSALAGAECIGSLSCSGEMTTNILRVCAPAPLENFYGAPLPHLPLVPLSACARVFWFLSMFRSAIAALAGPLVARCTSGIRRIPQIQRPIRLVSGCGAKPDTAHVPERTGVL